MQALRLLFLRHKVTTRCRNCAYSAAAVMPRKVDGICWGSVLHAMMQADREDSVAGNVRAKGSQINKPFSTLPGQYPYTLYIQVPCVYSLFVHIRSYIYIYISCE